MPASKFAAREEWQIAPILPIYRAEMSPKFGTSTGNHFWDSSVLPRKLLPVLVFTGAAPRRVSTSSGKKSVSQKRGSSPKAFPRPRQPLFAMPGSETGFREVLSAPKSRSDFCDLRLRCPSRTPEIARFLRQEKAMLHCDLRVRWKVASDLRFRAAISEPKTPSFCGISGDLAPSTRKALAIAIVRFWCAKVRLPPLPLRRVTAI